MAPYRHTCAFCLSLCLGVASAGNSTLLLPRDINFENNDAAPRFITDANGAVYFSASMTVASQSGGLINEQRLWISDGSEAGTLPLSGEAINALSARDPEQLAMRGGTLFFSARALDERSDPAVLFGRELWRSDGTPASTVMVADLHPGSASSNPTNLVAVGDSLFFAASSNNGAGRELWKSDGLPGGQTVMVRDIQPGSGSSIGVVAAAIAVGDLLFFWADDGVHGFELWKSDGTTAGTQMVRDINPTPGASSVGFDPNPATITGSRLHRPFNPVVIGTTLYFPADDGEHGIELWRSDGTAENTVMVADIHPGGSSGPSWLVEANGSLFFTADDGAAGRELWTARSTVPEGDVVTRVADIRPGPFSSRDASHDQMVAIGDRVYFAANDGIQGTALWRSEGSAANTVMVADLHPGSSGLEPVNKLTRLGNGLYFAADDGIAGVELWYSDGSAAGTRRAADINLGADDAIGLITGPRPIDLVASGGKLFLPAFEPQYGDELWATSGGAPDGFDATRTRPLDAPPPDPPPGPDIGVVLSFRPAGGDVRSGELFAVLASIYNNGPGTAYDVLLSAEIDSGGGHFSSSEFCIPPANRLVPPANVICPLRSLPQGLVRTVVFLGRAPEVTVPTAMEIIHNVRHSGVDPKLPNNTDRFVAMVLPPPPPPVAGVDLEVSLVELFDPVLPGAGIQYRITALNRGPEQATGVELSSQLPPEAEFLSVASTPEGVCSVTLDTLTCLLGALTKDDFASVDVVVRAPLVRGSLLATVTVSGQQVDPDLTNNVDAVTTYLDETYFLLVDGFEGG
jgi:uncharacterized repeat protein (TIGR01451 family)